MAITRPRIAGSVESCIRLLLVLVKVSAATPMTTSAMREQPVTGAICRERAAEPEDGGADQQILNLGFSRPAPSSAPAMVPTAMIDDSRPILPGVGVEDA